MKIKLPHVVSLLLLSGLALPGADAPLAVAPGFRVAPARILHHNSGLRVDVGVGLWGWPLPMEYNHDGLVDLMVAGSGKPYNGVYFYENTGITDPESGLPLLKGGVRLGDAIDSPQVSYAMARRS
ncbi:MAG: hypothetical protein EXS38_07840 [Opitutus sp.]|nr:hypothetical protein [Opitutus sp.]